MQPETVTIEKFVNGGYGLGQRSCGQVVLVRHVLPGEAVQVTLLADKKTHRFASLDKILTSHQQRRRPPCPLAGCCGGCDLQHADYTLQLQLKKAIIRELLERGGSSLAAATALLADPLAVSEELHYRQRLRLQVSAQGRLGYHRFQSHEVIATSSCPLGSALHNRVLTDLCVNPAAKKLFTAANELEIQENPSSGRALIIVHLRRKPRPADRAAAISLGETLADVDGVYLRGTDFSQLGPFGAGDSSSELAMGLHYPSSPALPQGLSLRWEVGGFCQVNLQQNRTLIDTVLAFTRAGSGQRILDLYCGMGNFSIPLALQGAEVVGIEGQAAAIRSANANAKAYANTTCRFLQHPIHAACQELVASGETFDCVVIDPPRSGAPDLADHLSRLAREKLVYISCDPATLCRDLQQLCRHGFSIRKLQPIDMFPQTHHIETVVLLEK
jgi:23S rRNA (uracil1939-C5)-methyltransferase